MYRRNTPVKPINVYKSKGGNPRKSEVRQDEAGLDGVRRRCWFCVGRGASKLLPEGRVGDGPAQRATPAWTHARAVAVPVSGLLAHLLAAIYRVWGGQLQVPLLPASGVV